MSIACRSLRLTNLVHNFRLGARVYLTGVEMEVCSQNASSSLKVISRNTSATPVDALGQQWLSLPWFTGDGLICFRVTLGEVRNCCVCRFET
jgi:hypothetical protein